MDTAFLDRLDDLELQVRRIQRDLDELRAEARDSADDDGGLFRVLVHAYYRAGALRLP